MRTVLLGLDILVGISGSEVIVRRIAAEVDEWDVLHESDDDE